LSQGAVEDEKRNRNRRRIRESDYVVIIIIVLPPVDISSHPDLILGAPP